MKTKRMSRKTLAMFLAIAVSPLCLLATDYYTMRNNGFGTDIYARENCWVALDETAATSAPSSGSNYYVVGYGVFSALNGGEFGGDSLSLGIPSNMTAPSWMDQRNRPPTIRLGRSATFTIDDFRLYSGTIHVQNNSTFDAVIAGTSTVYSTTGGGVKLKSYYNAASADMTRRSINLNAKLKGESNAVLTLEAGDSNGYWPTKPLFLILSGDFSEYHGSFSANGSLILLNTSTAFGCEADGANAAMYTVDNGTTMAIAADKSVAMSRTRGVTIAANKTLTLTTTNDFDEVVYSGYTVTFPVTGNNGSVLAKSGEGKVTLDSAFSSVRTINVENGILGFGPNYVSLADTTNLVLAAGTSIELADGACAEFATVSVDGADIDPGFYTGTGGPAYATPLTWISGTGVLVVSLETPATTVPASWNAAGSGGAMSVASNWAPETSPNLATGEFLPTFASTGSGAVADASGLVNGIVFDAPNDFTLSGAGTLTVLGGGITAASADYTVLAPLLAGVSQTWNVGEGATVAIAGDFESPRSTTVTKTGSGTLDISGTNPFSGAIAVTEGSLRLSGGFGRSAATDGALTKTAGATNIFAGVTVNKPVSQALKGTADELNAEAGTTNVFKGRASYSFGSNVQFTLGNGAVVVYENGLSLSSPDPKWKLFMRSDKAGPLVRFCGEPSDFSSANFTSYVTCRFETTGNRIGQYMFGDNSRLEATADYAWNGTDGIETLRVAGSKTFIDVGSTRQCIQNLSFNNATFKTTVAGDGGTLELAPTANQSISLTNLLFTQSVSLQKHGAADLTLVGGAAESYGNVAVTNGVLEFAADASWLNGTNVTVSGSGTLKIHAADTFNREHAVIRFADEGKIYVPAGVTQRFAKGWDGDTKMRDGLYETGGKSSRVTGGGAIQIGKLPGLIMIFR